MIFLLSVLQFGLYNEFAALTPSQYEKKIIEKLYTDVRRL